MDVGPLAAEIFGGRHPEVDEDLLGADGHANGLTVFDSGRNGNDDFLALLRLTWKNNNGRFKVF